MTFFLFLAFAAQSAAPGAMQHLQAGLEARKQHQVDVEITEFREAARLDPGLADAFLNLGAAYMEKHDYGAAITPLKRALELSPDLLVAHQFWVMPYWPRGMPLRPSRISSVSARRRLWELRRSKPAS